MNVGVMKDYKLRDLRTSHTLGWSWYWNTGSYAPRCVVGSVLLLFIMNQ
jgi:hypothetical protein